MCMAADADVVRSYEDMGLLVFEDATRAVAAIAALNALRESYECGLDEPPAVPAAQPVGSGPLSEHEAKRLLAQAGVPVLLERIVRSPADAVAAADGLGYPVAMKIVSADIAHKTEVGGVMLDVPNADAVRQAYEMLVERATATCPHARIVGVLVAPMAAAGVDVIVGVHRDATFGPVVMFGLGGIFVEVLRDVTFRLAPFDVREARRMIAEISGYDLLLGARGTQRADIEALARTLAAVSVFGAAHAQDIESIDINPLRVLPEGRGVVALDALIVPRAAKGDGDVPQ